MSESTLTSIGPARPNNAAYPGPSEWCKTFSLPFERTDIELIARSSTQDYTSHLRYMHSEASHVAHHHLSC